MATMTATPVSGRRTYGYDDLRRLMTLQTGDEKHLPSATSTLDVGVWVTELR